MLAVFTAAAFRVDRYIFPAAPACCLLACRGWRAARESHQATEFVATRAAALLTTAILMGAGAWLWWSLPRLALSLPQAAVVLPIALIVGGAAIMVTMARSGWAPPAAMDRGDGTERYYHIPAIILDISISNGLSNGRERGVITGDDGNYYYGTRAIRGGNRDIEVDMTLFFKDWSILPTQRSNPALTSLVVKLGSITWTFPTGRYLVDGSNWADMQNDQMDLTLKTVWESVAIS